MKTACRALLTTAAMTCLGFGPGLQPAVAQSTGAIQACADAAGTLRLVVVNGSRGCRSNEIPIN